MGKTVSPVLASKSLEPTVVPLWSLPVQRVDLTVAGKLLVAPCMSSYGGRTSQVCVRVHVGTLVPNVNAYVSYTTLSVKGFVFSIYLK